LFIVSLYATFSQSRCKVTTFFSNIQILTAKTAPNNEYFAFLGHKNAYFYQKVWLCQKKAVTLQAFLVYLPRSERK
jgi:hypothetical protein